MKILVFAHTPPPHHGQSYMVELMLQGLGGDRASDPGRPGEERKRAAVPFPELECYHVNARVSSSLADVGTMRLGKVLPLLRCCWLALQYRRRYGTQVLYYVPASPRRSALYRDWMVMALCRPFFPRVVFHWHAVGLGRWLRDHASGWERFLTRRLLGRVDLAVVLSEYNRADAEMLLPRHMAVVPNGIPDPCPDFEVGLERVRLEQAAARRAGLAASEKGDGSAQVTKVGVLYLAHCMRAKGVFDAVEGVRLANQQAEQAGLGIRFFLDVAGSFLEEGDKAEFEHTVQAPDLKGKVQYHGFVGGEAKARLLRAADLFCFPTYYENEGLPVNLLEALAHGLPVVSTRWRGIPELFPSAYPGLVEPRQPGQVAMGLKAVLTEDGLANRALFTERYALDGYLGGLRSAFRSLALPGA